METSLVGLAERAHTTRAIARAWRRGGFLPPPPYSRIDEVILRAGAAVHTTPLSVAEPRHRLMVRLLRGMCAEPALSDQSGLVVTTTSVVTVDAPHDLLTVCTTHPQQSWTWLPIGHWWAASTLPTALAPAPRPSPTLVGSPHSMEITLRRPAPDPEETREDPFG